MKGLRVCGFGVAFLLASIYSTSALECHICGSSSTDPGCFGKPDSSFPIGDDDPSLFCYTRMRTVGGLRYIFRAFANDSTIPGDGQCEFGAIKNTQNPEENYEKVCYCQKDACNDILFEDPPKMPSLISCYTCDKDTDSNCISNLQPSHLKEVPGVPRNYEDIAMLKDLQMSPAAQVSQGNGEQWDGSQEDIQEEVIPKPELDIGPYVYKPYCLTAYYIGDGGETVIRHRGFKFSSRPNMNGQCDISYTQGTEFRYCYCDNVPGCNNIPGTGDGWRVGPALLTLVLFSLSAISSQL